MIPDIIHKSLLAVAALIGAASCSQAPEAPSIDPSSRVFVSFNASNEPESTKVTLDFSKSRNVQWSDEDRAAVFDGALKNEFSIFAVRGPRGIPEDLSTALNKS